MYNYNKETIEWMHQCIDSLYARLILDEEIWDKWIISRFRKDVGFYQRQRRG